MLLQGCPDAKIALQTPGVVITDVTLNHLNKFVLYGESSAVIAFTFQNAPKALHGTVVDAVRHAGHTLQHTGLFNFVVKGTFCILEASVAVKQRTSVWIFLNSLIKGLKYERIVVAIADDEGYDTPVLEV